MVTKLSTVVDFGEKIIPIAFLVTRSNYRSSSQHGLINIL